MRRLARLTLIFAVAFAVLIIAPAFLSDSFVLYPLIKDGDVLDLFTPLVLIPLYWLLFQIHERCPPSQKETLIFLIFAVFWVQGQGIHLAANSIGHLTKAYSGSKIEQLTGFYDETLSHYIWHLGLVGLSALLIYRQWHHPFTKHRSKLKLEIVAGVVHGFNYFIDVVESATGILGVPFAAGVVLFVLVWGRQHIRQQPILAFFFVSYGIACLFFLSWGLYWRGLPEFSQVGIID